MEMRETTKWVLPDSEIPESWLNIALLVRAEYPLPVAGADKKPMTVNQLAELYSEECARIDMLDGRYGKDLHVSVPGEVMDEYRKYRCTPLFRARGLERTLDYQGRIFYKTEGGNPSGSHKPNTAIPQVFYAKKQGLKGVVTDTGAGYLHCSEPVCFQEIELLFYFAARNPPPLQAQIQLSRFFRRREFWHPIVSTCLTLCPRYLRAAYCGHSGDCRGLQKIASFHSAFSSSHRFDRIRPVSIDITCQ